MENKIIEIVEFGYPQSIIQRENEPITELIETELLVEQLESRIKELENTIENMKAIAGEKIKSVGIITSVDYPSDNTTELIEVFSNECGYIMQCTYCKEKHSTDFQSKFNFCPNCGRKIVR